MLFTKLIAIAALLLVSQTGLASAAPSYAVTQRLPQPSNPTVLYCVSDDFTSTTTIKARSGRSINCATPRFKVAKLTGHGQCESVRPDFRNAIRSFKPRDRGVECWLHTSSECADRNPIHVGADGVRTGGRVAAFGDNTSSFLCQHVAP